MHWTGRLCRMCRHTVQTHKPLAEGRERKGADRQIRALCACFLISLSLAFQKICAFQIAGLKLHSLSLCLSLSGSGPPSLALSCWRFAFNLILRTHSAQTLIMPSMIPAHTPMLFGRRAQCSRCTTIFIMALPLRGYPSNARRQPNGEALAYSLSLLQRTHGYHHLRSD